MSENATPASSQSNTVVSTDHQRLVLSGLMKDPYLLSIVGTELNDSYFNDSACKIIYKSLSEFYAKYSKMPTDAELSLAIESNFIELGPDLNTVRGVATQLFSSEPVDEQYLLDKCVELIKKVRVNRALNKTLEMIKNGASLDNEKLSGELIKSLDVSFNKSGIFCLSDFTKLSEARKKAVGDNEKLAIIKSILPSINTSLQYRGYQKGTLNLIVSPPGCFTGDTRIMTLDGKSKSLQEMYDSKCKIGIYGCSKDGEIVTDLGDSIYLSAYTDDLVEVHIDDEFVIKCTPDHPFMLRTGEYKQASQLSVGDELMPINRDDHELVKGHGSYYEVVINKDNVAKFTHHLSGELIDHPEGYTVVHHKDRNKYNNYPSNLVWLPDNSAHAKLHYNEGDYDGWIESGKATRFTSEGTRAMNLQNWQDPEYRKMMRKVSTENGKHYGATQYNTNENDQLYRKQCIVLSFINKLLKLTDDLTVDNYDEVVSTVSTPHNTTLMGIAKAFGCAIDVDGNRRHMKIDYDALKTKWSDILDRARVYNHKVTGVIKLKLDKKVPVYGIVDAGKYHNYALALNDDTGVFVSNTGKTSYLINEGSYAALQGFNVLHVFLGDMIQYDGFIRYAACISGRLQDDVVAMSQEEQFDLINQINSQYPDVFNRIHVLAYGSGEIDVDTLIETVKKEQERLGINFDDIIIDYADNFDKDNTQMYSEGGYIYDRLALFGRLNSSVMMVASQPKISYWKDEIIPLEGASESSKKQHIVDLLMTFNLVARDANIGTFFVPKVRRGISGRLIRVETHWECCRLNEISEDDYAVKKGQFTNA